MTIFFDPKTGVQSFAILLTLLFVGCGPDSRDLEYYGDITLTAGGIALTDPSEHQGGWGRKECMTCHNVSRNIHRGPNSVINADALAAKAITRGNSYCLVCHGPNGISN